MKRLSSLSFIVALIYLVGCADNAAPSDTNYTGKQASYSLSSASDYGIAGTVVVKERKDGAVSVNLKLTGTAALGSSDSQFPVHLHLGDVSLSKALVAAFLNPVSSKTATSETLLNKLGDDTLVDFTSFTKLNACIKVHLAAAGPDSDIVITGGNIGNAFKTSGSGRLSTIAVCGNK